MSNKALFYSIVVGLVFLFLYVSSVTAGEVDINKNTLDERIELIQASQKLTKEKKESQNPSSGISLYLTNFHTDETEFKLGGKYEHLLFGDYSSKKTNEILFAYVIDGIYLEGEDKPLAGFLSLKATLNNRIFSPYIGAGAEFLGVADYQGFIGLNINKNFFVETKFINDKDNLESGEFYSVTGFKIDF